MSLASVLTEFFGNYVSDELSTSYVVAIEDSELVMRHRRHGTINLTPAWKDDFRGGEWLGAKSQSPVREAGVTRKRHLSRAGLSVQS